MTQKFHKHYGATRKGTPQNQAIPGREAEMTKNNAGGYVFQVDPWMQLNRFLVLGTEGGSYYASERQMTVDNAKAVMQLLKTNGPKVIETVKDISVNGKAYKQDPALYALALAFTHGNAATKKKATEAFSSIVRIGTHLFTFLEYVTSMRGWGRNLRRVVQTWYKEKEAQDLAYQVTKYQQRNGWSHRDALRTSHPKPIKIEESTLYGYIVDKDKHKEWRGAEGEAFNYLRAVEEVRGGTSEANAVRLIREYNLPREVLPTEMLNSVKIWDALLDKMPITALIRNLGVMTSKDVIKPMAKRIPEIVEKLTNDNALRKGRVHPIQILAALKTYQAGHGARGTLSWVPVQQICDALDEAYYKTFDLLEPTGKRFCLGVDVSGSMTTGEICGVPGLTPRDGAAALAMVTARVEKQHYIHGFTSGDGYRYGRGSDVGGFVDLGISPRMRLDEVCRKVQKSNFGGTDCAIPMLWALQKKIEVDTFVILTDNETWAGNIAPTQALEQYRQRMGIDARLAVIGMTSTGFTIADPKDPRQMDFVGFSTDTPKILADFARGDI